MSIGRGRWTGISGLLFLVLVFIGIVFLGAEPALEASPAEVSSFFAERSRSYQIGALMVSIGLVFFIWFASDVGDVIETAAVGHRSSAAVVRSTGSAAAVVLLIHFASFAAAAFRPLEVDQQITSTLYDVSLLLTAPYALLLAGFLLAAGVGVLQTSALPSWLGWSAIASALVRAPSAGSFFNDSGLLAADSVLAMVGTLVWFLWVAAASIVLVARR
ncbi:MAG: hypothetical protein M3O70_13790 [Actinomycetota bacterium]|nr:hypothetical protein [Actinomycetota bacterium]